MEGKHPTSRIILESMLDQRKAMVPLEQSLRAKTQPGLMWLRVVVGVLGAATRSAWVMA
jgi:hypothetical protein